MVHSSKGWIGVDLDGTLADYSQGWQGPEIIGDPIPEMKARVDRWLAEGRDVRIFTARCWPLMGVSREADLALDANSSDPRVHEAATAVRAVFRWCREHFGRVLPITCVKDLAMVELYDDRCVQVIANTGQLVGQSSRGIPA